METLPLFYWFKGLHMKTELILRNSFKKDVVVWFTLGVTPGCLQDISKVPFIKKIVSSLVGAFPLKPGEETDPYAPDLLGFNGNLAFGARPLNCPTLTTPRGINLFEFILNNAFQPGQPQETVNISCVAGINCKIRAELGGESWNAGPNHPSVEAIENGRMYDNTGRVGVFPYGCDNCTSSDSPPQCPDHPPFEKPQHDKICTVQRDAIKSGGIILVTFLGDI